MAGSWSGLMKIYLGRKKDKNGRPSTRERASHKMSLLLSSQPQKTIALRYLPTYRLEAHNPLNREQCQKIMKTVMDKTFDNFIFTSKQAQDLCLHVSEEIKTRIKEKGYDRYRLVCLVTVGEKCMQFYKTVATFLWDATKDGYLKYVIDTPDFFAHATLFYIYYD